MSKYLPPVLAYALGRNTMSEAGYIFSTKDETSIAGLSNMPIIPSGKVVTIKDLLTGEVTEVTAHTASRMHNRHHSIIKINGVPVEDINKAIVNVLPDNTQILVLVKDGAYLTVVQKNNIDYTKHTLVCHPFVRTGKTRLESFYIADGVITTTGTCGRVTTASPMYISSYNGENMFASVGAPAPHNTDLHSAVSNEEDCESCAKLWERYGIDSERQHIDKYMQYKCLIERQKFFGDFDRLTFKVSTSPEQMYQHLAKRFEQEGIAIPLKKLDLTTKLIDGMKFSKWIAKHIPMRTFTESFFASLFDGIAMETYVTISRRLSDFARCSAEKQKEAVFTSCYEPDAGYSGSVLGWYSADRTALIYQHKSPSDHKILARSWLMFDTDTTHVSMPRMYPNETQVPTFVQALEQYMQILHKNDSLRMVGTGQKFRQDNHSASIYRDDPKWNYSCKPNAPMVNVTYQAVHCIDCGKVRESAARLKCCPKKQRCAHCGDTTARVMINNQYVCKACEEKLYARCTVCNSTVLRTEYDEHEECCKTCIAVKEKLPICRCCGKKSSVIHIDDSGDTFEFVCHTCFVDLMQKCVECGAIYPKGETHHCK